jgi:hypothetical protein
MSYIPTIHEVEALAKSQFPRVNPGRFFAHWSQRNWVNNKGEAMENPQQLEVAMNVWEHRVQTDSSSTPVHIAHELPKVLEKYQISPIPTRYAGILFRSRTEARWAVFLDHLNLKWEYEREGFEIGGVTRYLRDFWLPELDFWLEVKGDDPDDMDCDKAHKLAVASARRVYVFFGGHSMPDGPHGPSTAYCFYPDGGGDHGYFWCECSTCGRLGIEFEGRADRLSCKRQSCSKSNHGDKGHNYSTPRLCAATSAARSERFSR